jgi:hypothetical protein
MRIRFIIIVLAAMAITFTGCSKKDDAAAGGATTTTNLYSKANSVGPQFDDTAASSKIQPLDLTSGTNLYNLYQLFRYYDPAQHEGVIDMHNFYKLMYEIQSKVEGFGSSCTTITEQNIAPPYPGIDSTGWTFDCAKNDTTQTGYISAAAINAAAAANGDLYVVTGYKWAPQETEQIGAGSALASYVSSTKAFTVDMAHLTYYPAGGSMGGANGDGFGIRTYLAGTEADGSTPAQFSVVKSISTNLDGSSYITVVGKGVAEGTDGYFLFKFSTDGENYKYFCFPSGATETQLEAMTDAGYDAGDSEITTNCSDYVTAVDALSPFGPDDAPKALSAFTAGAGDSDPKVQLTFTE